MEKTNATKERRELISKLLEVVNSREEYEALERELSILLTVLGSKIERRELK